MARCLEAGLPVQVSVDVTGLVARFMRVRQSVEAHRVSVRVVLWKHGVLARRWTIYNRCTHTLVYIRNKDCTDFHDIATMTYSRSNAQRRPGEVSVWFVWFSTAGCLLYKNRILSNRKCVKDQFPAPNNNQYHQSNPPVSCARRKGSRPLSKASRSMRSMDRRSCAILALRHATSSGSRHT